jgi:cytochrome c5
MQPCNACNGRPRVRMTPRRDGERYGAKRKRPSVTPYDQACLVCHGTGVVHVPVTSAIRADYEPYPAF